MPVSEFSLTIPEIMARYAPDKECKIHPNSEKAYFSYRCPNPNHPSDTFNPHKGKFGSFVVHRNGEVAKCFACELHTNALQLYRLLTGERDFPTSIPPLPRESSPQKKPYYQFVPLEGCTVAGLAKAKGLPEDFLRKMLLWQDCSYNGVNAVRMPYADENHEDHQIRYRVGLTSDDRFRWEKGAQLRPYNLWALPFIQGQGYCILVEGETDTATLIHHNFPVLGIPGAEAWKPEWTKYLEGVQPTLWAEPDEGGRTLTRKVSTSIKDLRIITPPEGIKDPSDLYLSNPQGFSQTMEQLIQQATTREELAGRTISTLESDTWLQANYLKDYSNQVSDLLGSQYIIDSKASRREVAGKLATSLEASGMFLDATQVRECGTSYVRHECVNSKCVYCVQYHCNHRNCPYDALMRMNILFKEHEIELKAMSNPTVYLIELGVMRLTGDRDARAERIKKCYQEISDSLRALRQKAKSSGRYGGWASSLTEGSIQGIRVWMGLVDAISFGIVILTERDARVRTVLEAHIGDKFGDLRITDTNCHGIKGAWDLFSDKMSIPLLWDVPEQYLAWVQATKGKKLVQGTGSLYRVSGPRVSGKPKGEGGDDMWCLYCGNCKPLTLGRVAPGTPMKREQSPITGYWMLVPVDSS